MGSSILIFLLSLSLGFFEYHYDNSENSNYVAAWTISAYTMVIIFANYKLMKMYKTYNKLKRNKHKVYYATKG